MEAAGYFGGTSKNGMSRSAGFLSGLFFVFKHFELSSDNVYQTIEQIQTNLETEED